MTKGVSFLDAGIGVILATFGVLLVAGIGLGTASHAGVAAAVFVLLMTLPVIWRRPFPVAVAAVLGVGGVLNPLVIGDMVRCGPGLPALLFCAYSVGRRPVRLPRTLAAVALAFLLLSATVQSYTDPNLEGAVMVVMAPLIVGLYFVGRLIVSRSELAAELTKGNEMLRQQRERRAELAVQADRARIADGLDLTLFAEMNEMDIAAIEGRRALEEENSTVAAQAAFGVIQRHGRDTLTHMRSLVGALLERETTVPQPSLSQLDRLLDRAGPNDIHLHISGSPRPLPPGIELSAYRTLEHLLAAYGGTAGSRVDVVVDFTTESLALSVRGPSPDPVGLQAAVAAAQARLEVHRGSLSSICPDGRWEATARLPV